jgi:excisionase family DNA binding protein
VLTVPLDPYLSLRALSDYSGLSVRTLRAYLDDPRNPLPCYRPGGKVLVRRSEFDEWIARFRRRGRSDLDEIVTDALRGL